MIKKIGPSRGFFIGIALFVALWLLARVQVLHPNLIEDTFLTLFGLQWETGLPARRHVIFFLGPLAARTFGIANVDLYFGSVVAIILISPSLNAAGLRRLVVLLTAILLGLFLSPLSMIAFFGLHFCYYGILHGRIPFFISSRRTGMAFLFLLTSIVVGFAGALRQEGRIFSNLNFGLALFILQTPRLLLYRSDVTEGLVPDKVSPFTYLTIFAGPASFNVFSPQAYQHIIGNFRTIPLSQIWRRSLTPLFEALVAFGIGNLLVNLIANGGSRLLHVHIDPSLTSSFQDVAAAVPYALVGMLISGCLHVMSVFAYLMAVNQINIGIWRLLGFNVDSHFRFPYLGTTLAETWIRFSIHYRVTLTRIFFQPAYWKLHALNIPVRVGLSTFYSIIVGGLFFHAIQRGADSRFKPDALFYTIETMPYYLLLAFGVAVSQWRLLIHGRRKAWSSWRRWPMDLASTFAVLLFLGFAHLFASPETGYNGLRVFELIWSALWR